MAFSASPTQDFTVREYDPIYRGGNRSEFGECSIPEKDWDWLLQRFNRADSNSNLFSEAHRQGRRCLRARNYVGLIETPSGIRIEILPKLLRKEEDIQGSRQTLLKMLRQVLKLNMTEWELSRLATLNQPLHEVLISLFLSEVEHLVKRGLRSQYVLQQADQPFLRGRLRVEQQLNRRPGTRPGFSIEYHEYLLDRAENRLIHSAIVKVSGLSRSSQNQRRARTLRFLLAEIPTSTNPSHDFGRWRHDRTLVDYRSLRPWCELILSHQSPNSLAGGFDGLSFLFPMEQLFERYVTQKIKRNLPPGYKLIAQPARHSLVTHKGQGWFKLRPDMLVTAPDGSYCAALDTKWKQIHSHKGNGSDKYGISEADMYQMASYGQNCLEGKGDLCLIYPATGSFSSALPPFLVAPGLSIWAVPFDLQTDSCLLPLGDNQIPQRRCEFTPL